MPVYRSAFRGRACVECRQQKLRCDAHLDPSNHCSRCRRVGVSCEMSDTFYRRPRKTKAQMQREIEDLRHQARMSHGAEDAAHQIMLPSPLPQTSSLPEHTHTLVHRPEAPLTPRADTLSQALDDVEFEPHKIEDCFSLFFKHYFPTLPILDRRDDSPNWYYNYSPLLFWTVVSIGSRKYSQDPTMLETLGPRVASLAMQSIAKAHNYIALIQSLLLLCTWPFPMDTMVSDPCPSWAGLAMQLAVQHGLHFFERKQDFTTKIAQSPTRDGFRALLWSYCKIVCQMTNICNGLQPATVTDAFTSPKLQQRDAIDVLGPSVFWAQRLQAVLTDGTSTLMREVYPVGNSSLSTIIDGFDDTIVQIGHEADSHISSLLVSGARLHIRSFHFYENDGLLRRARLIGMYDLACSFIEAVASADQATDYALYSSESVYRTLNMAASAILRVTWSDLRDQVDSTVGERAYFSCIHILKRRMIRNNDLNGRTAGVLTQLWRSPQTFKRKDGSYNSLAVRIRTRGSIGIFYDCFWCWAREFNGQTDPYFEQSGDRTTAAMPTDLQEDDIVDESLLGDVEQLLPFLGAFLPDSDFSIGLQIPPVP
ncbi:hypothetical protein BO71DRAFT_440989 [Aspergillus ellipticus CBS 707.79]|uniref:Zn(2)-C6 fungal-type domain-containing protein n=1 Tax=Aspergillus ellipticus CBS 707.79 TaxID=1448320 RepID=A0A319DT49_9EURO|nr:hypothetical protein BO71DRAFT_440989 [Aspergillus ellipticus CBS 707.79]